VKKIMHQKANQDAFVLQPGQMTACANLSLAHNASRRKIGSACSLVAGKDQDPAPVLVTRLAVTMFVKES
jgi:hypothetical protein